MRSRGMTKPAVWVLRMLINFVHQWASQAPTAAAVVPSIDNNPIFEAPVNASGYRWTFTITLTEEAGVAATLTGFTINGQSYDVATVFGTTSLPADGSVSSTGLGFANLAVPTNVVFAFTGTDAKGNPWTQTLSVPFDGPQTQLIVGGASNAASGQQSYAPGMLLSVYGTALGDFVQSAGTIPLPQYLAGFEAWVNGVTAPLYYVSPNQVNIQIPYETQPGTTTLTVGNPYVNVNYTLTIAPAAPGIFMTDGFTAAPFSSAARGQTVTLFITGEGQVSPALADGTDTRSGNSARQPAQPEASRNAHGRGSAGGHRLRWHPERSGGSDANQLHGSRECTARRSASGGYRGWCCQPGGQVDGDQLNTIRSVRSLWSRLSHAVILLEVETELACVRK